LAGIYKVARLIPAVGRRDEQDGFRAVGRELSAQVLEQVLAFGIRICAESHELLSLKKGPA
jgi:hypothetical protein